MSDHIKHCRSFQNMTLQEYADAHPVTLTPVDVEINRLYGELR